MSRVLISRIELSMLTRLSTPLRIERLSPRYPHLLNPHRSEHPRDCTTSSKLSMSSLGSQVTLSFSGMQNRQAKLHLSVTEILTFLATRPLLSCSDIDFAFAPRSRLKTFSGDPHFANLSSRKEYRYCAVRSGSMTRDQYR